MADHARQDRHLDPDAAASPVRLLPGLLADPGHVTVLIGDQDAATPRGQLLTWATVNLLLRCYGVLVTVTVHCPDVPLAAPLPRVPADSAPLSLHQALAVLATATADPDGRGPRLVLQPGGPARPGAVGTVTLVLGTQYASMVAGSPPGDATWLVTAGAWKLSIATPAALTRADLTRLPRLDEDGPVSVAVWLASALGCAEAFKNIGRLKAGRGRAIEAFSVNLWTLTGSDGFAELATADGPAEPPQLPAHYVVGAGAVAEAYLAVLATSDVSTSLALLDDDVLGDTNLNRHILAAWADLGEPKATLAQDRLSGYRMRIFPVNARWQDYLATPPAERPARPEALTITEASGTYDLVISAVDRNRSRVAIAGSRPQVILGGSTNGLEAEVGRYQAGSSWQCLACASPPEPDPSIEQAASQLAAKTPAELAALAQQQGLDLAAITEYLNHPECGTLGEREVQRFAALDRPDWSVSFVSVAAGALLAARALTHIAGDDAERTAAEGDTLRLWLANATMTRTAHRRNPGCPVCGMATAALTSHRL
jgi:molybdopterin/thiamine biosynthesis adenylyltransferase